MTAVKARTASPQAVPSERTRSTAAWSSPRRFIDWRRIQNSIQVTTTAARSMAEPSKICSYGSSNAPTVLKITSPRATLRMIAAPEPSQIFGMWRPLPVRTT